MAMRQWIRPFLLGVAAGVTAQAIAALWHWLRAPALSRVMSDER
jgi:hypothetical protein